MTLTAPSPISAGIASLLDADIPFLLAVVMFFLVFAIGHATGRVEARVRASERRASQARHPSARQRRTYARFDAELTQTLYARPQRLADAPIPRLTIPQLADWERRFSEALRVQLPTTLAALDDQPWQVQFPRPDKRVVCGRPASTNLGAVRCLARPGHPGDC